jgi:Annexin
VKHLTPLSWNEPVLGRLYAFVGLEKILTQIMASPHLQESKLLKALGSQNAENRCKIAMRYPLLHGKDLKAVMKSECGNRDFGTALQFLAVPSHEMECDMIKKAVGGVGANRDILFPIVCGRSNKEMEILKKKYFELFTKDLGQVMAGELGGDMEALVLTCMQGSEESFDPDFHTDELMIADMETIYKAGQGRIGTNEKGLFKILAQRPTEYMKTMNLKYADKYGYTIPKVLEKELGGKVEDAACFMIGMKLKPYETIAKLIKTACAGFGTNELLLTCCLIRYQCVLKEVMVAHIELCKYDTVSIVHV